MYENILFTITVDTEADDAWEARDSIGMRNLSAIPRFQALCEEFEIMPTYLLTYECAVRQEALAVLKSIADQHSCEIGFHLHSWTTPPFERESPEGFDAAWMQAYQFELPESLFREKSACLLEAIENAYGIRPTAHRAGRWGIDQRSVDWLIEKKFLIDTSVVPMWDLSAKMGKRMGGPSFLAARHSPYFWLHSQAGNNLSRSLLEIPLTVYAPRSIILAAMAGYIRRNMAGKRVVERIYRRFIGGNGQLRLHPKYSLNTLLKIIQSQLSGYPTIINMMIHSSELMVGQSPFSRTPQACEALWEKLRWTFAFIRDLRISSAGISASPAHLEKVKIEHENFDSAPRFQRPWWSRGLLPKAPGKILDAGEASNYRNPAG